MTITFRHIAPKEDALAFSRQFDAQYESTLQCTDEELSSLYECANFAWMYVDGALAGESFFIAVSALHTSDEDIPDVPHGSYANAAYVYSTTILPAYQGKGYGTLLCAHMAGIAYAKDYDCLIGHATSPAMIAIRTKLGARFDPAKVHTNWYDSGRAAHFYEMDIS